MSGLKVFSTFTCSSVGDTSLLSSLSAPLVCPWILLFWFLVVVDGSTLTFTLASVLVGPLDTDDFSNEVSEKSVPILSPKHHWVYGLVGAAVLLFRENRGSIIGYGGTGWWVQGAGKHKCGALKMQQFSIAIRAVVAVLDRHSLAAGSLD